jgi:DnaK suppressor protein
MEQLSTEDIDHLREALISRQAQLSGEVREGIERRSGEDSFEAQTGEVPDTGDMSVAIEENDLRNAEMSRDAAELDGIETALARMKSGDYGTCSTCGEDISLARLTATPTAERCIRCQTLWESQHDTPTGSTI